jgi:hypothetical protein
MHLELTLRTLTTRLVLRSCAICTLDWDLLQNISSNYDLKEQSHEIFYWHFLVMNLFPCQSLMMELKKKIHRDIQETQCLPGVNDTSKALSCMLDTKILDHSLVSEYKCSPLSLTQVGHQSKVLEAFGARPASLTRVVVHWGGKPRQSCCQPCSSLKSVVATRETL